MLALVVFLVVVLLVVTIVLGISILILVINAKYKRFVLEHSIALRELESINQRYSFNLIKNFNMSHAYDNERFYNTISPKDYLVYQLVYIKKEVAKAIADTSENNIVFQRYRQEITEKCVPNTFDVEETLENKKKLAKTENKLFIKFAKTPQIVFYIYVRLDLTRINGRHVYYKEGYFNADEISSLIKRIKNQKNGRFLDEEIWKSVVRVERGKVSNKMRFAIYSRDGYRCRMCGRKTNDLEVDHIIPIAKGGKTTYNNLQTLCHYCNAKKGSDIYIY